MATLNNIKEHRLKTRSYKYMWARYVAKRAFDEDIKSASKRLIEAQKANPDLFSDTITEKMYVGTILAKTQEEIGTGLVPRDSKKLDIAIIGAGVAGLFTALVFDWLNEQCKDEGLKINYDIMEAAEEDRLGGRLYTHRFSDAEHDYYDVGAMRFPNNTIMKRTFQLFNYLDMKPGKGGLIPYYMKDVDGVCPTYFNDVRKVGNVWAQKTDDPFKINSGLDDKDKIPEEYLKGDPSKLIETVLDKLIKSTKAEFDAILDKDENGKEATKFWEKLMRTDKLSVRQFLALGKDDKPSGPGFNYNTIEWLESATYGTGWYDQSLTECVLEQLDFATPKTREGEPETNYWWCVDGGANTIAQRMAKKIKNPIQFKSQVVAIDAQIPKRKEKNDYTPMKLEISNGEATKEKEYFAIFNSTTLGAFQRMNLKDAGLLWGTKQAIRALGYGASCKVAIKFKTAWWQKEPFCIRKGGLAHTDLPLRVCVYPSYNIEENEGDDWNPDKPAVLLCSYTWGQDAQRIGALISSDSPKNEEQLVSVLLHDLALLHAPEEKGEWDYKNLLKKLKEQYLDHHAYDWYSDQNMSGAFAYFGPGQFSNMWQEIIKPNAYGQLYLVGEASSSHHAWIVGALESVIRAVYLMFEGLQKQEPDNKAYKKVVKLLSQAPKDDPDSEDGNVFGSPPGDGPPGDGPPGDGPPGSGPSGGGPHGDGPSDGGPSDRDPSGGGGPSKPQKMPSGLPFFPLPEEMPDRLLGVSEKEEVLRDPLDKNDEYKEGAAILLSVAMIGVSLLESWLDFELDDKTKPQ